MDTAFVEGCTDGMTILCSDGIERVFFLHIMTYSTDYPKKWVDQLSNCKFGHCITHRALLATIKNLRCNPCPQCLIRKENIHNLGTAADAMQHRRICADNMLRCWDVEKDTKHCISMVVRSQACKFEVPSQLAQWYLLPGWVSTYRTMLS